MVRTNKFSMGDSELTEISKFTNYKILAISTRSVFEKRQLMELV